MNTPLTHRFVALALSVAVTLGLFQTIGHFCDPKHRQQLLVRMLADAPVRS